MDNFVFMPQDIKNKFYKILLGEISIEEFESWVYTSTELKACLGTDTYFDFISFDYKSKSAQYEIQNLILKHIDKSEFETWRIKNLLLSALTRTGDYPLAICLFYDLYCHGYSFLDSLGLGYGLTLDCPYTSYGVSSFKELSAEQKVKLVDSLYPGIQSEITKVLNWLDSGLIVLTGNKRENNYYEYIDNRSEEEKYPPAYKWS